MCHAVCNDYRSHNSAGNCRSYPCRRFPCQGNWCMVTACSKLRKVLLLALSVTFSFVFCLCMKYVRNRWTDLHQVHGRCVWPHARTRDKKCSVHCHHPPAVIEWNALAAINMMQQQMGPFCRCRGMIPAACVWFMFSKTSSILVRLIFMPADCYSS